MLDFSFAEIALIVVVAVLFIGPNELPVVIRTIGKAMRAIRGLTKEMRSLFDEISRESGLEEAAKDVREITMIKGDDGKMYESYNHPFSPPPVGGRPGGGHSLEEPSLKSPHPNPPPNGEGEL